MQTLFEGMRELAARPGWKLDPENPGLLNLYATVTLTGSDAGIPLRIERVGGSQQLTTMALLDPPLPVHFAITHEGLGGKIANLFGFHDAEIGDAEFDKSFRIVAKDVKALIGILTPEVKKAIQELATHARRGHVNPLGLQEFFISEGGVSLMRVTGPSVLTSDELLFDVPITTALARALRAATT